MKLLIIAAVVAAVGILHFGFLTLEMFFWTKPLGLKIFAQSRAQAESSKVLAANQGLYNGFIGAGLLWALILPVGETSYEFKVFFLGCAVIAGIYGAFTVSRRIFWVQAAPAFVGLFLLLI